MTHLDWIKHITLLLRLASEKVPEWRFGQMIENLKRGIGIEDLFYVEDEMLAEHIIKYFGLDEDFQKFPKLEPQTPRTKVSVFEDIKTGLNEAIEYEKNRSDLCE